jgi:putative two-component system hydrogenase maturation factor HypX/HoxX
MGNTGAGGVFLARAADEVWAKSSVILNPHYKDMGNLYGSEYWSYLLPRYTSSKDTQYIMKNRLPTGIKEALSIGLVNKSIDGDKTDFINTVKQKAEKLSNSPSYGTQLKQKNEQREKDENNKPLQQYRNEELSHMKRNFYGFDTSYHIARYNFVFKVKKSRTPVTIARHRKQS